MEPEETDHFQGNVKRLTEYFNSLGAQSAQRGDIVPVQETDGDGEELAASLVERESADGIDDYTPLSNEPEPERNRFPDFQNSELGRKPTDQTNIKQDEKDISMDHSKKTHSRLPKSTSATHNISCAEDQSCANSSEATPNTDVVFLYVVQANLVEKNKERVHPAFFSTSGFGEQIAGREFSTSLSSTTKKPDALSNLTVDVKETSSRKKLLVNDDATSDSPCPDLTDEQSVTVTHSASTSNSFASNTESNTCTSFDPLSPQPADAVNSNSTRRGYEVNSDQRGVADRSTLEERINDQEHSSAPEKNDLASSSTPVGDLHDSGHTADGNKSQETAEDLLPHLAKEVINKNYHPIGEDVLNFIKGHAERRVKFGAIYQAPNNSKDIEIVGENVEFLRQFIFETMGQFPGYTFKITECTNPMHVDHYLGNGFFKVHQKFHVAKPTGYANFPNPPITSTCGLILQCESGGVYPITEYYAVMAGHGVMKGYMDKLLNRETTVEQVRQEISSNADNVRYHLETRFPLRRTINDLCGLHPRFCFRWSQQEEPQNSYTMFMNDIALLRIENWQLLGEEEQQPGVKTSQLVLAMNERKDYVLTSQVLEERKNVIQDEIFALTSPNVLKQMGEAGVLLLVGNETGCMVPCGVTIPHERSTVPLAIEFVVLGGELHPGQSGLIAYVKHKEKQNLYPFGLFVGLHQRQHALGPPVYVAVVLHSALEELKSRYLRLTNLRPIFRMDQSGSSQIPLSDLATCSQVPREIAEKHMPGQALSSPPGNTVTDSGVDPSRMPMDTTQ